MSTISKKQVYSFNGKDYDTEIEALKAREELFIKESKQGLWDFFASRTLSIGTDGVSNYEYPLYKTSKVFALPHNLSTAEQYALINNYCFLQKKSLYHTIMNKNYLWEKTEYLGYGSDIWDKISNDKKEDSDNLISDIIVIKDFNNFYTIN